MTFACLYIPDFYAQAVARCEPELRGRALAVVEPSPPPFRVFALNAAARQAGAEPGMSRVEAAELPGVQVRGRSPAAEISAHAATLDLARSFSPRFEDYAVDTVTLDLAGLEALSGSPEQIARRICESAQALGLEANVALAPNPDAARLAARGFTGITLIGNREESTRLGELPVDVLDPAPEVQETLERWGIGTFRALAALPAAELSERLGQEGIRLQQLARGAALRALVPAPEPLRFEEAMDLEYSVAELDPLAFILGRLLNQLCARLATRGRATQELRLVLTLEGGHEDRQIENRNRNPKPEIRNSEIPDVPIAGRIQDDQRVSNFEFRASNSEFRMLRLPFPICDSRLLLKLWLLDLEARPPAEPVLKVAIEAEPVWPRVAQGDLFLPRAPDPQKLEVTLARLRGVVGENRAGSPELLDTHRPDALRMRKYTAAGNSISVSRNSKVESRKSKVEIGSRNSKRDFPGGDARHEFRVSGFEFRISHPALRLFRPPLAAQVELRDGRPVRIEAHHGRRASVRGPVTSAAGPWRTSGDWWTDQPWEHDEWDVEIAVGRLIDKVESRRSKVERVQLYRIYCDLTKGEWFLAGLYD
jgi:protein ImuB